jgi:hypothetical protein
MSLASRNYWIAEDAEVNRGKRTTRIGESISGFGIQDFGFRI